MTYQEKSRAKSPIIDIDTVSDAKSSKSKEGGLTPFQTANLGDFAYSPSKKPKIVHEEKEKEVEACKSTQLIVCLIAC